MDYVKQAKTNLVMKKKIWRNFWNDIEDNLVGVKTNDNI
jgi:hypothetical protein